MTPDGRSRGFAHIEYSNLNDAVSAVDSCAAEPIYIQDRDVRVDFAPPRQVANMEPNSKLYFVDFNADEETIRSSFQEYARDITSVYLCTLSHVSSRLFNVCFADKFF